jgi:hypothetical protein
MSLSAALLLAAASASATPSPEAPRGAVLAQARVSATILPAATVRRADEQVGADAAAPHHEVRRHGHRVLVEFQ